MPAHSAKPSWWEIQVIDLEAAQTFYGEVFGWTFQTYGPNYLGAIDDSGQPGGGVYTSDTDPGRAGGRGIRFYFDTSELEAVLERVRAAGGNVTTERTLISEEMGWYADFEDPSGVRIGLSTSKPA